MGCGDSTWRRVAGPWSLVVVLSKNNTYHRGTEKGSVSWGGLLLLCRRTGRDVRISVDLTPFHDKAYMLQGTNIGQGSESTAMISAYLIGSQRALSRLAPLPMAKFPFIMCFV